MIVSGLLFISLLLLFLPVADFPDDALGMVQADIDKFTRRVAEYQATYDRYVSQGDTKEKLDKQQVKIDKAKETLDEYLAEAEALESGESGATLRYAFLPGKLPTELSFDQARINESKIYSPNMGQYYLLVYLAVGLLLGALILMLLGRGKLISKFYTGSSILNMAGILALLYAILRLNALPIMNPFRDAKLTGLQYPLLLVPFVALLINSSGVRNTKRTMLYVLCTALSILSILPFWLMLVNATRSTYQIQQGVSLIPSSYFMNNLNILTGKQFDIMVGFKNSAIIAFGATFLSVYFSSLTAYGLSVYTFRGSKFLYGFILAIIMIPGQVTATGFYMFMYRLGLVNSYIPLIIPAIAASGTVFFLKQYLSSNLQISLVEASRIDGAGEFFTFNRIVMPLMMPAMATMGIITVIGSWNNYLTPLMLLSNPTMKTLPMMVKELRGDIYRTEYGSIYVGLSLTALPLMIVYFALSKYIIAGVAVGGVKE
jgi:multiple sugar transport system permease protein